MCHRCRELPAATSKEELRQQVLQNYFQGLQQALGAMTPEMMQQVQQMVRDLNELLQAHRMGVWQ